MTGNATGGRLPFWATGWFWLVLALLSTAPFVFTPLPPIPDFFSHMGRYHVMNHGGQSAYLSKYYAFQWHVIGNLGVDLVMVPMGRLLPTEMAATLVVAAIPPLTILGIYAVAKAVWGRIEAPALLGLGFVYSFSFVYGFVNYHLALVLALWVFALWVRAESWPVWRRYLVFAPLGALVWLAHVAGWGALLVMVGAWELASASREEARVPAMAQRLILRLPPLLLPMVFILAWRTGAAATGPQFGFYWPLKVTWPFNSLKSENKVFDVACAIFIGAVALWMLVSRRFAKDYRMLAVAGALLVAYLAMPTMLFQSFFADERLLPPLFFALVLAMSAPRLKDQAIVAMIALAFFGVRLTAITIGWHERGGEAAGELRALDGVPNGSRIAAFAAPAYCAAWELHGFEHLPSLAIIRREAFVNTEWDTPGAQLMRPIYNDGFGFNDADSAYLPGHNGRCTGEALSSRLQRLPRSRFDYVWIFDEPLQSLPWLRLQFSGAHGKLYAVTH